VSPKSGPRRTRPVEILEVRVSIPTGFPSGHVQLRDTVELEDLWRYRLDVDPDEGLAVFDSPIHGFGIVDVDPEVDEPDRLDRVSGIVRAESASTSC
jgi:hypothetical protein